MIKVGFPELRVPMMYIEVGQIKRVFVVVVVVVCFLLFLCFCLFVCFVLFFVLILVAIN